MNRRVYYRLTLVTASALSIGASASFTTDADVAVDCCGRPFIPASSLAGVLRHALKEENKRRAIFGELGFGQSVVKVYDACLLNEASVSVRDSVALVEDDKVAKRSGKFDRQVVDRGARFVWYLEIEGEAKGVNVEVEIEQLLARLHAGEIRLGSKTSRGMGLLELENGSYQKKTFGPDSVESWLDFDMFDDGAWGCGDSKSVDQIIPTGAVFDLSLSVRGALSIRQYTTELPDMLAGQSVAPDFKQFSLAATGEPVIPGTSWAGAFRAQYRKLSGKRDFEIAELFGTVDGNAVKSKVAFSESVVSGGEWKLITRNSIDCYTGGTIAGALFTELAHFGGKAGLRITVDCPKAEWLILTVASIADLHNGFMAMGGLTAVGHGLFAVESASLTIDGACVESFGDAFGGDGLVTPDMGEIAKEIELLLEEAE